MAIHGRTAKAEGAKAIARFGGGKLLGKEERLASLERCDRPGPCRTNNGSRWLNPAQRIGALLGPAHAEEPQAGFGEDEGQDGQKDRRHAEPHRAPSPAATAAARDCIPVVHEYARSPIRAAVCAAPIVRRVYHERKIQSIAQRHRRGEFVGAAFGVQAGRGWAGVGLLVTVALLTVNVWLAARLVEEQRRGSREHAFWVALPAGTFRPPSVRAPFCCWRPRATRNGAAPTSAS